VTFLFQVPVPRAVLNVRGSEHRLRPPRQTVMSAEEPPCESSPGSNGNRTSDFFWTSTQSPSLPPSPASPRVSPPGHLDLPPTSPIIIGPSISPAFRQSQTDQLRLFPVPTYLIGSGRHADVFLAAYRRPYDVSPHWALCTTKRVHGDRDSQTAGLSEAFVLTRLAANSSESHPNIVRLIGIRDERDIERPSDQGNRDLRPRNPRSRGSHARWFSEVSGKPSPSSKLACTDESDVPTVDHSPTAIPDSSCQVRRAVSLREQLSGNGAIDAASLLGSSDPPRIILLLEYCPLGTLGDFMSRHPDQIDSALFYRFATGLADGIAFCHSRGILHADVKPQNVLVGYLC
jgi:hypothetical protein